MAWAKIDDRLHAHPKAEAAGLEAMGLWALAMSFCAAYLTDGAITCDRVFRIAGERGNELATRLVKAGLWLVIEDGWQFHDWSDYQPTRASVESDKAKKQAAGRASAEARRRPKGTCVGTPVEQERQQPKQKPVQRELRDGCSTGLEAATGGARQAIGDDLDAYVETQELPSVPTHVPTPVPTPVELRARVPSRPVHDQIQSDPCVPALGVLPARVVAGTHTGEPRGPVSDPSQTHPTAPTPKPQLADEPVAPGVFTTANELQAELGLYPILAPLANDLRYADELLGTLIARGVSRAAVRRSCQEFQIKNAFDARSKSPPELARFLGGYFIGAKSRAASRAVEATGQDAQALLALFDELWREAHDGQPRGADIGDEQHAAELVVLCRNAGTKVGFEAQDVFRHVAKQYFFDERPFIRDELHPLRLLAKRFSSYELPRRPVPTNGSKKKIHGPPADPKTVSENVRRFHEQVAESKAGKRKIQRGDYGGES